MIIANKKQIQTPKMTVTKFHLRAGELSVHELYHSWKRTEVLHHVAQRALSAVAIYYPDSHVRIVGHRESRSTTEFGLKVMPTTNRDVSPMPDWLKRNKLNGANTIEVFILPIC